MINGDGLGESTSKLAPLDPFDSFSSRRGPESDGEPASPASSSRYSSCGESEFERYCSANSVMGTPSLCSSVGYFNDCVSEFGSMRSFDFGDDGGGLENFNLGGSGKLSFLPRADSAGENRTTFGIGNVCSEPRTNYGSGGLELYENEEMVLLSELNCGGSRVRTEVESGLEVPETVASGFAHDHELDSLAFGFQNNTGKESESSLGLADYSKECPAPVKIENHELGEYYDDIVQDMEEILLDSSESPGPNGPNNLQGNHMSQSHQSTSLQDSVSSASTSGSGDAYPLTQHVLKLDSIEVVGAKQKRGDVSLSERMVGVKEHTVYRIKVWSGKNQWEIERRYRDFLALYHRLKTLFSEKGLALPSPWLTVEKESRKLFNNASPDVIAERSVLIQECLQSILLTRFFQSPQSPLIWFLSPPDLNHILSLVLEHHQHKSVKQMLEEQHYTCAGCRKQSDYKKSPMLDFVQTLGWSKGKPRICVYTGKLFCSSCHANESAILPAKVLHHWDFTRYPVSHLAKLYLDSIQDKPMLCVSAVNPLLFTKVPALQHVMSVRKKIATMLPFVRCPFRRAINKGLGSRRYLLEGNDFFSLRDLIDLSKGVFAALPVMVETISRKIKEHITEQCLICCDVGVPCGAREACNDPSSLIFPFQEDEVRRCNSCQAVFHKRCCKKLEDCPCGGQLAVDVRVKTRALLGGRASSGLHVGLLSGLFAKAKPVKMEHRDGDTVILMGSLPSTCL